MKRFKTFQEEAEKDPEKEHYTKEDLTEEPANNVGSGNIAGTVGDPPVSPRKKKSDENHI